MDEAYSTIDIDTIRLRRREQILKVFSLTSGVSNLLLLVITLSLILAQQLVEQVGIAAHSILLFISGLTWLLAHRKQIELGAHLFFSTGILTVMFVSLPEGITSLAIPLCFGTIVGATLVLKPYWSFIYAGLSLATCLVITLLSPLFASIPDVNTQLLGVIVYGMYFFIIALLAYFSARELLGLLRTSQNDTQQLAKLRTTLSELVEARTLELQQALALVENRAREQALLLQENAQQREIIRELSIPVLPISNDVLVIPMVGTFDSERLNQIQEQALRSIEKTIARTIILDITGVPVIDTQVAQGLVSVVQAAQLMGTQTILVGIRPEVAQALVSLGVNLDDIATASSLQAALRLPRYRSFPLH